MPHAIFKREVNWSRPRSIYSFNAKASPEPQERPRDFIDYAVAKGWAVEVPAKAGRNRVKAGTNRKA
jgi:hypothetical protein